MTPGSLLRNGATMALRDWRGGELRLLALALVIAVAAVTSVGFFVDRIRLGLQRDVTQLMGGDVVVSGDAPLADALRDQAHAAGLATAETISFPSMALNVLHPERSALVALKAVSPGYPLRGALRLQVQPAEPGQPAQPATPDQAVHPAALDQPVLPAALDQPVHQVPPHGTAWVDPQLLGALQLRIGDRLKIGEASFRIDRLISVEPDRGVQFATFAPRVMIGLADLPATELLQPGSRATYRLLAAGATAAVRGFVARTAPHLGRGQQLESLDDGRPEMQRTLERAQRFLSLVALLAALMAAVAVASAARRFSQRHLDACALLRCLGLVQRELFGLFLVEFACVGVAACLLGTLLGLGMHLALVRVLASLLEANLPAPSLRPALQGIACGLVLLFGFAMPPLAQLRRVAPLRMLRRDLGAPTAGNALGYLAGAGGFALLLLWSAGDLKLSALVAGGFALGVIVFAAVAALLLRLAAPLRMASGRYGLSWRFALAAMSRRPAATVMQVVALAIGLMALLLLVEVRTDLVSAWRRQAPPDAPNRFVINIQPDQAERVAQRLQQAGVVGGRLYPMVRGRLIERNGKAVSAADYDDERARRLVDREFNLSYADAPSASSPVIAGKWFAPDGAELSLESGLAKTLRLKLGDRLVFEIGGEPVAATISSLRKVNWDSMQVNFFVVMPTRLLADKPRSFVTAFHLPPGGDAVTSDLVQEFSNLTVIDTTAVLAQVQAVLDQVIQAVEFLFGFTLAAGVLVMVSALASSHDERAREAALLRALGARRGQLQRAHAFELVAVGALAGLLAAAGAAAIGWSLAYYAFEFDYAPPLWMFAAGLAAGIASAWGGGWAGLRRVLNAPPMTSLREAT